VNYYAQAGLPSFVLTASRNTVRQNLPKDIRLRELKGQSTDLKNRGDTVHLDVEAAIPSRNVDKDSSRRILREVTPVDLVNSRKHIY
jgi:hypothetical protein